MNRNTNLSSLQFSQFCSTTAAEPIKKTYRHNTSSSSGNKKEKTIINNNGREDDGGHYHQNAVYGKKKQFQHLLDHQLNELLCEFREQLMMLENTALAHLRGHIKNIFTTN